MFTPVGLAIQKGQVIIKVFLKELFYFMDMEFFTKNQAVCSQILAPACSFYGKRCPAFYPFLQYIQKTQKTIGLGVKKNRLYVNAGS